MKFIKYEIEQGLYYDLITIYAKQTKIPRFISLFQRAIL